MDSRDWTLQGKKAVVTGASQGIGRAIAFEFARLNAEVLAVARSAENLARLKADLAAENPSSHLVTLVADVATPGGREMIEAQVQKLWGTLNILVNNVGTNIRRRLVDYTQEEIEQIFSTNLWSAVGLCRLLFRPLSAAGVASVINIGSVAGLTALRSGAPYGMTKAALSQLTRNLAVEWAPSHIRVNAVAPWYIETPLAAPVLNDRQSLQEVIAKTPLRRVGQAHEVAAAVAFLAMDKASYITGQTLAIDGGFMAYGF